VRSKIQKLTSKLGEAAVRRDNASPAKRAAADDNVTALRTALEKGQQSLDELSDYRRVYLTLFNGSAVEPSALRWSCKRLAADLALGSIVGKQSGSPTPVSRADRLGRAAAGAEIPGNVAIAGLFDEAEWNGRLQAPRPQLDSIARHVEKHGWDAKADGMVRRIRWLVSFSAKLTPHGPWTSYCDRFTDESPARPFISKRGDFAVKYLDNDKRSGHGKLILSRLPGIRVLAVDLGHRFAAACAVWQAMSRSEMEIACRQAGVAAPAALTMNVSLNETDVRGKKRTALYRRIGADQLPDGSIHPAPWARLDRQFVIKLQGEDRPSRKASPSEFEAVLAFERWAGRTPPSAGAPRRLAVATLMSEAVRTARLALARHGRRARIAHNLTAQYRTRPGARQERLNDDTRLELLTETLCDWHTLATDESWRDGAALEFWNQQFSKLPGGFEVHRREKLEDADGLGRVKRRQQETALRKSLEPLARALAADANLRESLHEAWAARWQADDAMWRDKLRWLARWLMPRGGNRRDATRRKVGGLSLTRISTLTEFRRKVQVGYFTRMNPEGTRAEINPRFGQATLDAINHLKDNRVKQLASRLVEAALGVGIERRGSNGRDLARPRQPIADSRFAPCHAVVIEDLTHYRPEETRTRRENRATMDWKSAEARKRLEDHCHLHGLFLRDVNPQYTSRQDSRTGLPGIRCDDVPLDEFLNAPWWRKKVRLAKSRFDSGGNDPLDQFVVDLERKWSNAGDPGRKDAKPLRLPRPGGNLFIVAPPHRTMTDEFDQLASRTVQADLNAAANIGLRALLDPDFPGKWWYVPCDSTTHRPKVEKVKGSILDGLSELSRPLSMNEVANRKSGRAKRGSEKREIVNLWRDPEASAIRGAAGDERWHETGHYWKMVQERVIGLLRYHAGLGSSTEQHIGEIAFSN
jgi:IS605 OrfB family transposase